MEDETTNIQVFEAENRLISMTTGEQTMQFVYDGDGNPSGSLRTSLVKKINPNGSKTIYVGGIYEVDKTSSGSVTHTRVYSPARGAMRVDGTLYYVLKDHLGCASVVTYASGEIDSEQW